MTKFTKVPTGDAVWTFAASFGCDGAAVVEGVREWMRARKRGIVLTVTKTGGIAGYMRPELDAGTIEDMVAFVAERLERGAPEVNLDDTRPQKAAVLVLGISEDGADNAKVHTLDEVQTALEHRGRPSATVQEVTLVYGGWTDGDTVGTGQQAAVIIDVNNIAHAQAENLGEQLALAFNQQRFYLESERGCGLYEPRADEAAEASEA